jgi:hypothetical protein
VSKLENAERKSAVSQAISRMQQGKPAIEPEVKPITAELLERLGDALLWNIVVEPYIPKQRGLITKAQMSIEAERILSQVARIVLVGCFAWRSKTTSGLDLAEETHKPVVGDYVLHEAYAGTEIHLVSGHMLRILTETECKLRVKDPELIRAWL